MHNTGKRIVVCCILLCFNIVSYGQSTSGTTGFWSMLFNQTQLSEKWGFQTDIQHRSYEIAPNIEQLLIRAGLNYHLNKRTYTTIGYASVLNYSIDKNEFPERQIFENRTWQQLSIRDELGRIKLEHRYRIEQRWIKSVENERYLNRIRYLLRTSIPLNTNEIKRNTVFVGCYNELFINLSSTPFDRNRLYGALGFQFLTNANIQIGGMAQTVGKVTKPYLQFALNYNLDFRDLN
jgi:hypothetical protein